MKWLALRVGGQKITVHIVREEHPKLEGANGIYLPDECAVYLSRDLAPSAREDVLFHELDHVVNEIAGVNNLISSASTAKQRADLEEQMVRARTPIWHALLKDLGFRFPKGPHDS